MAEIGGQHGEPRDDAVAPMSKSPNGTSTPLLCLLSVKFPGQHRQLLLCTGNGHVCQQFFEERLTFVRRIRRIRS